MLLLVAISTLSFGIGDLGAASACSATNVHITPTVVTATGWNSACGGWYRCTGTFLNYDPFDHHWGVLRFNPKGTSEGEWTGDDDSDFSINGHCKAVGSSVWLIPASKLASMIGKKSQAQPVSSPSTGTNTGTNTGTDTTTDGTILGSLITQLNEPLWSL